MERTNSGLPPKVWLWPICVVLLTFCIVAIVGIWAEGRVIYSFHQGYGVPKTVGQAIWGRLSDTNKNVSTEVDR